MREVEVEACQVRDNKSIPAQLDLLAEALDALRYCTHPDDIAMWTNHLALAKAILS
jgi:hypothetical protein